jgi:hypothetical protein
MTEADVHKFALANRLPMAYVKPFFNSMSAVASTNQANQGQVPYSVFHSYVTSRERALKRIFDKLDAGASACMLHEGQLARKRGPEPVTG